MDRQLTGRLIFELSDWIIRWLALLVIGRLTGF